MEPTKYLYFKTPDTLEYVGKAPESILSKMMVYHHDLRSPNERIYYIRSWVDDDGVVWQDYGSYDCFYLISEIPLL